MDNLLTNFQVKVIRWITSFVSNSNNSSNTNPSYPTAESTTPADESSSWDFLMASGRAAQASIESDIRITGCGGGSAAGSGDITDIPAKDTVKHDTHDTYFPSETEQDNFNLLDQDGDGFISIDYKGSFCAEMPPSLDTSSLSPEDLKQYCDCNDAVAEIHPGAKEVEGDGTDQNCSGMGDEDLDLDGYTADGKMVDGKLLKDCDDNNPLVHPGAKEICGDGKDNNCDGITDEGCPPTCVDNDKDGYGNNCAAGPDCNDGDPLIHPGAEEVCKDGIDNNCNDAIDEGCGTTCKEGEEVKTYDGPEGTAGVGICQPEIKVCENGIFIIKQKQQKPQPETPCNGIDEDCNYVDFKGTDKDGDGFTVEGGLCGDPDCDDSNPDIFPDYLFGENETFNCKDDNCNGQIDDVKVKTESASAIFEGELAGDNAARTIAVGDINGDGFADILVGNLNYIKPDGTNSNQSGENRAYLLFGKNFTGLHSLSEADVLFYNNYAVPPTADPKMPLSAGGDVNLDGLGDALIGFNFYGCSAGSSSITYLFYGSKTWKDKYPFDQASATFESPLCNKEYAIDINTSGDINADGFNDIIIATTSQTYLFYGGKDLAGKFTFGQADATFNIAGRVTVGDVNKDGYDDILISWSNIDCTEVSCVDAGTGKARLFWGGKLSGQTNYASAAAVFSGEKSGDGFGTSASIMGDVNGDGYADIVIGAPKSNNVAYLAGMAYLFWGKAGLSGQIPASSADLPLPGVSEVVSGFGGTILTGADFKKDKKSDIVIGSINPNPANNQPTSHTHLYYGEDIAGSNTRFFYKYQLTPYLGDVNGDTYPDLVFSAEKGSINDKQRVYIYYGGQCK